MIATYATTHVGISDTQTVPFNKIDSESAESILWHLDPFMDWTFDVFQFNRFELRVATTTKTLLFNSIFQIT
jgi:hypothetical protein